MSWGIVGDCGWQSGVQLASLAQQQQQRQRCSVWSLRHQLTIISRRRGGGIAAPSISPRRAAPHVSVCLPRDRHPARVCLSGRRRASRHARGGAPGRATGVSSCQLRHSHLCLHYTFITILAATVGVMTTVYEPRTAQRSAAEQTQSTSFFAQAPAPMPCVVIRV